MLTITILGDEFYDEVADEFSTMGDFELQLEHSLASLSKWESEFRKPFLSQKDKTTEETLAYIRLMSLTPNVPPEVLQKLSSENLDAINAYITTPHTATWFQETPDRPNREIITAEIIYYWMIAANIPFECEHWHLDKLLTLIKVVGEKNAPAKKLSRSELAQRNRALNEQRLREQNTTG